MANGKRALKVIAGLLVTAIFLWILERNLDADSLSQALARITWQSLFFGLAFLAVGYTLRIVRWWLLLRPLEPGLPLKTCVWPFLSSIAVNNVLPFRAGDALRVFGFRKQLRSPAMRVLGTLIVERLLDILSILSFFFAGVLALPDSAIPDTYITLATWLAALGSGFLLILILSAPYLAPLVRKILGLSMFRNAHWRAPAEALSSNLISAFSVLHTPGKALTLIGCSAAIWAFEGAVFAAVVHSFDLDFHVFAGWFSMATGTLATMLPSSPGYVGTFDYFAAQGLVAYGSSTETAVAFAITVHAVLWAPLTLIGLSYLAIYSWRVNMFSARAIEERQ